MVYILMYSFIILYTWKQVYCEPHKLARYGNVQVYNGTNEADNNNT